MRESTTPTPVRIQRLEANIKMMEEAILGSKRPGPIVKNRKEALKLLKELRDSLPEAERIGL